MMKSVLRFGILIACGAISFAHARGTNSGGGGKVVVCPSGVPDSKPVELLDLWEVRKNLNPYLKLTPIESNESVAAQVAAGIARLKGAIELSPRETHGWESERYLGALMQGVADAFILQKNKQPGFFAPVIVPQYNVRLKLTPDSYEVSEPELPCEIKQAVIFDDAGELAYVNYTLVDQMDNMNKAALYLHEAFYKALRTFSYEESSLRVRRAVGAAMSGLSFQRISTQIPSDRIECASKSGDTLVYIYKTDSGYFGTTAERIAGVRAIGYSTPAPRADRARDIAEFYETWLAPNGSRPYSLDQRNWHSPVDYDMNYSLRAKVADGQRRVYVTLNTSPGKAKQEVEEEVSCRLNIERNLK